MAGRPHTARVVVFSFSPFYAAAVGLSPLLAVRLFSWCFSQDAILGPARFLDSPGTCGAELARPFKGGFALLVCGCCSPFCLVCLPHVSSSPSR